MKKLIIAVLSLTTAFTGVPAFAAPAFVQRPAVSSDMSPTNAAPVEKVEWRHHRNWVARAVTTAAITVAITVIVMIVTGITTAVTTTMQGRLSVV